MPRFSLSRLFAGAITFSIGVGTIVCLSRIDGYPALPRLFFIAWVGSGALIGAGLLWPFNRPGLGYVLGIILPLPLTIQLLHDLLYQLKY
jgi:hypothetical protein